MAYEQFKHAWVPEDVDGDYPAKVSVGRNLTNDWQVIMILELEISATEFEEKRAALTRPDTLERRAEIVDTTELTGHLRRRVRRHESPQTGTVLEAMPLSL